MNSIASQFIIWHIVLCIRQINDSDTANMQIRILTWGLAMHSVKHQFF